MINDSQKKCSICKEIKSVEDFHGDKIHGYYSSCKSCKNARTRQRYWKDPEYHRERSREWAKEHPDLIKRKKRIYKENNTAKLLAYRKKYIQENKDKIRIGRKNLYLKKREESIEYARKMYKQKSTSEEFRKNNRARVFVWHKENPEKVSAQRKKRRALKKNATVCDFTAAQWREMKAVYGHRCVYCRKKSQRLTQDHIIPLSKGGNHTASNIVPACRTCNSRKGTGAVLVPIQPMLLLASIPQPSIRQKAHPVPYQPVAQQ